MLRNGASDAVTANFGKVPYLIIVLVPLNPAEFALNFEIISGERLFPQVKCWDIYMFELWENRHIAIPQYIYIVKYITHRRLGIMKN